MKLKFKLIFPFAALLFASCFGMSSDITIKKDGSGSVALVYKISRDLIELGKLDGNSAMPTVPVGEEDFKRTVQRIDGLNLTKFSSKPENEDYIYSVNIEFTKIEALIEFLDTQGQHCKLTEKDGKHILTVIISSAGTEQNSEMEGLIPIIFSGYEFGFKLNLPLAANVTWFNSNTDAIPGPSVGSAKFSSGKNFIYNASMSDLLTTQDIVGFEIIW